MWKANMTSAFWWALLTALWAEAWSSKPEKPAVPCLQSLLGTILSSLSVVPLATADLPVAALLAAASAGITAAMTLRASELRSSPQNTKPTASSSTVRATSVQATQSEHRADAEVSRQWTKGAIGTVLLQILLAWQAIGAYHERQVEPPGELVEVADGRTLHLHCVGVGLHTAVLDSGLPFSSLAWESVLRLHYQRLERNFSLPLRLCAYDRAGYGWSPAAESVRDGPALVEDLGNLLAAAKIERPVLVGWSYGGHIVSAYACKNPSNVTGLVLVDATAPNAFFCIPGFKSFWSLGLFMYRLAAFLQPVGFFRVLWAGGWGPLTPQAGGPPPGLPADAAYRMAAQCSSWSYPSTAVSELLGMKAGDDLVSSCFTDPGAAAKDPPLGETPVISIYAADHISAMGSGAGCSEAPFSVSKMSVNSRVIQAGSGTDHFFLVKMPELILDALDELLDRSSQALQR